MLGLPSDELGRFPGLSPRSIVQLASRAGSRVRCILDGGRNDVQPHLAAWGVPVHVALVPLTWAPTSGVPTYFYVRRGLVPPSAELTESTRATFRERAKYSMEMDRRDADVALG